MVSWIAHYKNKYPGCKIHCSDTVLDVFSKDDEHLIALRKNGAGMWADQSEHFGCTMRHDLSPLDESQTVWVEKLGRLVRR